MVQIINEKVLKHRTTINVAFNSFLIAMIKQHGYYNESIKLKLSLTQVNIIKDQSMLVSQLVLILCLVRNCSIVSTKEFNGSHFNLPRALKYLIL